MGEAFLNLIIVFPLIIVLIFVSLKSSQKFINQRGGKRNLQVIEQVRVSPKAMISVIKMGESYLLIGSGDEQVSLLKELSKEEIEIFSAELQYSNTLNVLEATKQVTKLKEQWKK